MWLRYILTASPFKPLSPLGPWKIKMKEVTNKFSHWLLKIMFAHWESQVLVKLVLKLIMGFHKLNKVKT